MNEGAFRFMIYKIILDKIENNGFAQIKVNGGSMLPILFPEDIVMIKPLAEYRCGDIVVFYSLDGRIIVHRIILVRKKFYITKGDSNLFYDEEVPKCRVLGKVISWNSNGCQYKFKLSFLRLKTILYLSKREVLLASYKKWRIYITNSKNRVLESGKICIFTSEKGEFSTNDESTLLEV